MERHELLPLFTELRGPRVTLRPLHPDDAQTIFDAIIASREELRPWLPFVPLYEQPDGFDEMRSFIARCQADWIMRDNFNLSIWRNEDGQHLGQIGLHPRNWSIRSFEIGYWQRTDVSGQGYVTEAARLLTEFAIFDLHAQRVMIRCDARNERSANVARRLGYVQEGLMRNYEAPGPDGQLRDILIFSRLPSDPPMP